MGRPRKASTLFKVFRGANGSVAYRLDRKFAARLVQSREELRLCCRIFGHGSQAGARAAVAADRLEQFLQACGLGQPAGPAPADGKARAAGE